MGTQGFSPRTRSDAQLIRFGEPAGRIALRGERTGVTVDIEVTLELAGPKRAKVNGARLRASEQLRSEVSTLVFTPDRLALVKGGPAARRAYFDRALARLSPARASLPVEYHAVLAQRNAALRRTALGYSSRDALSPWTQRVAELGRNLVQARGETLCALGPGFAARAGDLGLDEARLGYDAEAPTAADLDARLDRDLERGATGLGPHLDDVLIAAGARDLRAFGSQGEQRLAVLSLLLAEAELVRERRGIPPLVLLDDVLSELDPARREALVERIAALRGQTVVTATTAEALPGEPDQVVDVWAGEARAR